MSRIRQHNQSDDSTSGDTDREGGLRGTAPGKLSDGDSLGAEVRTVLFFFALAGLVSAIVGYYAGSYFVAAIAASIAVIVLLPIFARCIPS